MTKNNLFFIGGAKGVGKTSLTHIISLETGIARLETGRVLAEYVSIHPPSSFKNYVTERIAENKKDILLDTHFAQYPPYAKEKSPFERGLNPENLSKLSYNFNIHLCLLELNPEELLQRRLNDTKKRVIIPSLISEELEYNNLASRIYSKELNKPVFRLENKYFDETKLKLEEWIKLFQKIGRDNNAP